MQEEFRRIVRTVVNDADPVHLLSLGCEEDEYEPVVTDIVRRMLIRGKMRDGIELVLLIQEVFDHWYSPGRVRWGRCLNLAETIYTEMQEYNRHGRSFDDRFDGGDP